MRISDWSSEVCSSDLKDPQKRAAYDRFGHAAFRNGGASGPGGFGAQDFGGFSDIFENIFGEFMGGGRGGRQNVRRGADLRYDMEITLAIGRASCRERVCPYV